MNHKLHNHTKHIQPNRLHFKQEFEKLYYDALSQENLSLAFKILQTLQTQNSQEESLCPCKTDIHNIESLIITLKKWIV